MIKFLKEYIQQIFREKKIYSNRNGKINRRYDSQIKNRKNI